MISLEHPTFFCEHLTGSQSRPIYHKTKKGEQTCPPSSCILHPASWIGAKRHILHRRAAPSSCIGAQRHPASCILHPASARSAILHPASCIPYPASFHGSFPGIRRLNDMSVKESRRAEVTKRKVARYIFISWRVKASAAYTMLLEKSMAVTWRWVRPKQRR